MADTLFQWPGGKSRMFKRIQSMMPQHKCYVEGFGGSGAVLLNKEPADVDVYNDLDSDLVHFFTVYREAPDRLIEWLHGVPYSYETYQEFGMAFYHWDEEDSDYEPPAPVLESSMVSSDDISHGHIQRAGIFFCLRYMQFGAKYQSKSGFGRSKVQNGAATFSNAKKRLKEFVGCFDSVTIENVSYEKLIDYYDSEDTFFYFDPPYIGTESYYLESDFSHDKFCDNLESIEGKWMVSYDEIPDRLEDYYISREKSTNFINSGVKGEGKETVETLITNYDPEEVRKWSNEDQTGLSSWGDKNTDDDGFLSDVIEEMEMGN